MYKYPCMYACFHTHYDAAPKTKQAKQDSLGLEASGSFDIKPILMPQEANSTRMHRVPKAMSKGTLISEHEKKTTFLYKHIYIFLSPPTLIFNTGPIPPRSIPKFSPSIIRESSIGYLIPLISDQRPFIRGNK